MARFDLEAATAAGLIPAQAGGEAYYELGILYASGRAMPIDLVAAHQWFNIAAARGFRPALERRAEVAREMSAADIAAAQRAARAWLARQ